MFSERHDYEKSRLLESDLVADPFEQFRRWYEAASSNPDVHEANAMTVATCTNEGMPSARIVLLRGLDSGFVFYTNFESRKGRELTHNPNAALLFYWPEIEQEVRIEGTVARVAPIESDEYFASRPYRSKLGALISRQSSVIAGPEVISQQMQQLESRYAEGDAIPRPDYWGGFRVTPHTIEFWQGRRSRLHDRIRYKRNDESWIVERLSP